MKQITVLVVDDSALMRKEIRGILESDSEIKVIGTSRNGVDALQQIAKLNPNVVTLDVNMPEMDGLTVLQHIMMEFPRPVLMLSSLTQVGSTTTFEALELGAVDFVGKPGGTISHNMGYIAADIIFKVKAAASADLRKLGASRKRRRLQSQSLPREFPKIMPPRNEYSSEKILVIGQSTGGPGTIFEIIPHLPASLGVPVIIIQHMPGSFTPGFAKRLDDNCNFSFKHAAHGDILQPGCGYLAPGNIHMTLMSRDSEKKENAIRLSKTPTGTLHTPSIDITMDSVLSFYGANTIGVLLTGMGSDGANAMANIRRSGGRTIVESEETCVVFGMPKEAILRGGAEFILPSYEIAKKIINLVRK
ncbi:MAG: chemotaxis response regulator protein-glutamate methylesterase [Bdellovibrionia bacterium]